MDVERDESVRRLGGAPVSVRNLSDTELQARRIQFYARQGRLPPEFVLIRKKPSLSRGARGQRDG